MWFTQEIETVEDSTFFLSKFSAEIYEVTLHQVTMTELSLGMFLLLLVKLSHVLVNHNCFADRLA